MNDRFSRRSEERTGGTNPLQEARRIFNSVWDRELRSAVYGTIYMYHSQAKRWTDNPKPEDEEYAPEGPPYLRQTSVMVSVIEKLWWSALNRAFDKAPETGADVEYPLPESVRTDMFKCDPEGFVFRKDHTYRTCGKYAVCPWCRYRHGRWICERLAPYLQQADIIASAKVVEGGVPAEGRLSPAFRQLIKTISKTKRPWMCDVTIPLPVYDQKTKLWYPSVTIIALARKGVVLPRLEALCTFEKWKSHPLFLGRRGKAMKATESNLARTVANAIRYPAELLYSNTDPSTFLQLASFSRWCRTAFHGVPRGSSRE